MFTERDAERLLKEDAPGGDVTSRAVAEGRARAEVVAREDAVIAGLDEAATVFRVAGAELFPEARDGAEVTGGEVVATAEGPSYALLLAERTGINIVMRMSGISTVTRRAVEAARAVNPDVRVAGTRKTAPGLRHLDKRAVELGGGDPHRLGLSHAYLVKENHAALVGLEEAVDRVLEERSFIQTVEVEVESTEQAIAVAKKGVDALLLDNFSPKELESCVEELHEEVEEPPLIEASGGITPRNVAEYAPYVDVVSMGWLTHSAPASDFSMRLSAEQGA